MYIHLAPRSQFTQSVLAQLIRTLPKAIRTDPNDSFRAESAGLALTLLVIGANGWKFLALIAVADVKKTTITVQITFRGLTRASLTCQWWRTRLLVAIRLGHASKLALSVR